MLDPFILQYWYKETSPLVEYRRKGNFQVNSLVHQYWMSMHQTTLQ